MKMIKEGTLVHIPAAALLQKYNVEDGNTDIVTGWKTFDTPHTLLVSDTNSIRDHVGVLFQNEVWYIKKKEVYTIDEEQENE